MVITVSAVVLAGTTGRIDKESDDIKDTIPMLSIHGHFHMLHGAVICEVALSTAGRTPATFPAGLSPSHHGHSRTL